MKIKNEIVIRQDQLNGVAKNETERVKTEYKKESIEIIQFMKLYSFNKFQKLDN